LDALVALPFHVSHDHLVGEAGLLGVARNDRLLGGPSQPCSPSVSRLLHPQGWLC